MAAFHIGQHQKLGMSDTNCLEVMSKVFIFFPCMKKKFHKEMCKIKNSETQLAMFVSLNAQEINTIPPLKIPVRRLQPFQTKLTWNCCFSEYTKLKKVLHMTGQSGKACISV